MPYVTLRPFPAAPLLRPVNKGHADMMGGASASPPPPPPPPPAPIQTANATSQTAGKAATASAAAANGQGFDGTITNTGGSAGQSSTPVGQKTLLGQ
jgi:hypothetical protein